MTEVRKVRVLPGVMATQAVLIASPIATIDALTGTTRSIGAQLTRSDIYATITTGLPFLLALLPVSMVAVGFAVRRRTRGALFASGILSTVSVLVAVLPDMRSMTFAAPVLHGVALGAAGVLALGLVAKAWPRRTNELGRSCAGRVTAGVTLALALVMGIAGARSTSIPGGLASKLIVDELEFHTATPQASLAATPPTQNPQLAPDPGNNIHGDAAMSDAYTDRSVLDPRGARVISQHLGGVCASVLFDAYGRLIAVCVTPTSVLMNVVAPDSLKVLARRQVADRPFRADFATNFSGGGYAVLDHENHVLLPTADGRITRWSVADEAGDPEVKLIDEFDVSTALANGEPINSAVPDATGPLWIVGKEGTVAVFDLTTGKARSMRFAGADIENSFAVASGGGAYVVTLQALHRLSMVDGAPQVVWTERYDTGDRQKPGQTSRASGTTPTLLMNERYVAITDNADPQMNVVVYDTSVDLVEGDREVCRVPVFARHRSATENSLIAIGNSLFVENNYGYSLFTSTSGQSSEPGLTRIDIAQDGSDCSTVWSNNDVRIPSVVSKGTAAGVLVSYTKDVSTLGADAWYFTAVDETTGQEMWRRLAGIGSLFNNHYAAIYIGPDGALYVGTVGGLVALLPAA